MASPLVVAVPKVTVALEVPAVAQPELPALLAHLYSTTLIVARAGPQIAQITQIKIEIRNSKFEIRDPKFENRNPKFENQNPKFENRDLEFGIWNLEFEAADLDSGIRNPEFQMPFRPCLAFWLSFTIRPLSLPIESSVGAPLVGARVLSSQPC